MIISTIKNADMIISTNPKILLRTTPPLIWNQRNERNSTIVIFATTVNESVSSPPSYLFPHSVSTMISTDWFIHLFHLFFLSSINQSINPLINQSINQSIHINITNKFLLRSMILWLRRHLPVVRRRHKSYHFNKDNHAFAFMARHWTWYVVIVSRSDWIEWGHWCWYHCIVVMVVVLWISCCEFRVVMRMRIQQAMLICFMTTW